MSESLCFASSSLAHHAKMYIASYSFHNFSKGIDNSIPNYGRALVSTGSRIKNIMQAQRGKALKRIAPLIINANSNYKLAAVA